MHVKSKGKRKREKRRREEKSGSEKRTAAEHEDMYAHHSGFRSQPISVRQSVSNRSVMRKVTWLHRLKAFLVSIFFVLSSLRAAHLVLAMLLG
jgi:hypothetical protein